MSSADHRFERAVEIINRHGCPICGEPAGRLSVRFVDAIDIAPCGHVVVPQDAFDMERLHEELRRMEVG